MVCLYKTELPVKNCNSRGDYRQLIKKIENIFHFSLEFRGCLYEPAASRAGPLSQGLCLFTDYLSGKDSVYMESGTSPVSWDLT